VARALGSARAMRALPDETHRLFPGYPAVVRLAASVAPWPWAALGVNALAAVGAVLLFYQLTRDAWLSAYFAVFTPSWLLYSATAMSEGLFLLVALGAFSLWRGGARLSAALAFSFLTLVRPVGALVFAACWLSGWPRTRARTRLLSALVYLAPLGVAALMAWRLWGDPLRPVHAYVAKDFSWPFLSLLGQTFSAHGGWAKVGLVWFTVACALVALGGLWGRWRRARGESDLAWLLWAAFAAAFFLLLPSRWAFGSLDRFFVASLPPTMLGLRRWFPRRAWCLAVVAIAGLVICLYWNHHMVSAYRATIAGAVTR
jgi:hypothetical protein